MAHGSNGHGSHGVGGYVLVAVILAIITYVEFAIVEYEIAWLSSSVILWSLIIMSVVKFLMVILYFMHLREDDVAYSGFFASGMTIAMGTFVVFTLLMTAPHSISFFRAAAAPGATPGAHGADPHDAHHGLDDHVMALIESDGYSRDLLQIMRTGRPKDSSLAFAPPQAATDGWTLASAAPEAAAEDAAERANAADPEESQPEPPAADAPAGEDAVADDPERQPGDPAWDPERGQEVFRSNCAGCHQPQGQGVPGAFPPLADHAAEVAAAEGGRDYLIHVLLYGLQGRIEVQGDAYDGAMPAWGHLSDERIADVINLSVSLGGDTGLPDGYEPVLAEDVAEHRDEGLTPSDVHDQREGLDLP